jgi:hypothetical protein
MINQPWLKIPEMKNFKDYRYASTSFEKTLIDDLQSHPGDHVSENYPLNRCLLTSSFIEIEI